ncbi:MAG: hypothetical protein AAFZ02_01830 [Pseudomonadota bacterium]
MRAETGGVGRVWPIGAAALLAALAILYPFTQALYLPLTDLPNHIARHTIMAAGDGSPLAQYWTSTFVIVPNSAVDLLWQAIGEGSAILFSHRVMAFAALNLFASALVLAYVVHGRITAWTLAAGLAVFSATFLYGFQNYSFSLPFAIYAFALYLALEARPVWQRLAVFVAITPVLFIMHFFAFAILATLAFGREAQKLLERRDLASLGQGALMAVPFLLPLAYLLFSMATGPENPAGNHTEFGSFATRILRFAGPMHSYALDMTGALNSTIFIITMVLYGIFLTSILPFHWGLKVAPAMRLPVLILLAVAALAPTWLAGVALIDIRFPFVFILVMIASTELRLPSPRGAVAVGAIVLALIGFRSHQMATYWGAHDAEMRDLTALLDETVEPSDRILPVFGPGNFSNANSRLWHVQAYATATNGAFIPTLFQGVHAVQLRPEWEAYATPLMHTNPTCALFEAAPKEKFRDREWCQVEAYLADWPEKFTKVLAMDALAPEITEGAPVRLIGRQGRFEIYEVLPARTASPSS